MFRLIALCFLHNSHIRRSYDAVQCGVLLCSQRVLCNHAVQNSIIYYIYTVYTRQQLNTKKAKGTAAFTQFSLYCVIRKQSYCGKPKLRAVKLTTLIIAECGLSADKSAMGRCYHRYFTSGFLLGLFHFSIIFTHFATAFVLTIKHVFRM